MNNRGITTKISSRITKMLVLIFQNAKALTAMAKAEALPGLGWYNPICNKVKTKIHLNRKNFRKQWASPNKGPCPVLAYGPLM
jgi:hypothetical protein